MAWCKTAAFPLLARCRHCSVVPSHRYVWSFIRTENSISYNDTRKHTHTHTHTHTKKSTKMYEGETPTPQKDIMAQRAHSWIQKIIILWSADLSIQNIIVCLDHKLRHCGCSPSIQGRAEFSNVHCPELWIVYSERPSDFSAVHTFQIQTIQCHIYCKSVQYTFHFGSCWHQDIAA